MTKQAAFPSLRSAAKNGLQWEMFWTEMDVLVP